MISIVLAVILGAGSPNIIDPSLREFTRDVKIGDTKITIRKFPGECFLNLESAPDIKAWMRLGLAIAPSGQRLLQVVAPCGAAGTTFTKGYFPINGFYASISELEQVTLTDDLLTEARDVGCEEFRKATLKDPLQFKQKIKQELGESFSEEGYEDGLDLGVIGEDTTSCYRGAAWKLKGQPWRIEIETFVVVKGKTIFFTSHTETKGHSKEEVDKALRGTQRRIQSLISVNNPQPDFIHPGPLVPTPKHENGGR